MKTTVVENRRKVSISKFRLTITYIYHIILPT